MKKSQLKHYLNVFLLASILLFLIIVPIFSIASPSWWNSSWSYRKNISINNTKVFDDLVDFPVLIKLNNSNFNFTKAQSNGEDIRFTNESGVALNYEIESWNSTTNESFIWVRANLSSGADTILYMYYGNAGASDGQSAEDVWDSGHMAVWHMTGANATDSTSYSNNASETSVGAVNPNASGKIDGDNEFDASSGCINATHSSSLDITGNQITIETWIYPNNVGANQKVTRKDPRIMFMTGISSGNIRFALSKGGTWDICILDTSTAPLSNNNWYHMIGTYDGTYCYIYVNGMEIKKSASTSGNIISTTQPIGIGGYHGTSWTGLFDGRIDEFRISNISRSAHWLNTSYQNQLAPFDFYSIGDEEESDSPPTFSGNADNSSSSQPLQDTDIQLNLTVSDDVAVNFAILSWNDTGDWLNITNFTTGDATSFKIVANETVTATALNTIGWKVWANDSTNQVATSSIYTFIVRAVPPPPKTYNHSPHLIWHLNGKLSWYE